MTVIGIDTQTQWHTLSVCLSVTHKHNHNACTLCSEKLVLIEVPHSITTLEELRIATCNWASIGSFTVLNAYRKAAEFLCSEKTPKENS